MSNSPLVDYTKISPNSTNPRQNKIKKITIHHVAGNLTVEQIGKVFVPRSRRASANYGIDSDGRVGMYVEEKNRAWTSGSADNDHEAVTIEVANSKKNGDWPVSDKALNKLIDLCVDICKRNGIEKLNYTGDSKGNLTRHNMFQATLCPGPYLQSRFPYIAGKVNKELMKQESKHSKSSKTSTSKPKKENLVVDGYWGPATTRALQKYFETTVDGVISGQYRNSITEAIPSVQFGKGGKYTGSDVILELQKLIGATPDRYIGKETVRALQRYLGTPADSKISKPSLMVKEIQKKLNQGKL